MGNYIKKIAKIENMTNSIEIPKKPIREFLDDSYGYLNRRGDDGILLQEANIRKVLVDSIRHHTKNYIKTCHKIKSVHLGSNKLAYYKFKNTVLNKIGEEYPFLKDECNRQKHSVELVRRV